MITLDIALRSSDVDIEVDPNSLDTYGDCWNCGCQSMARVYVDREYCEESCLECSPLALAHAVGAVRDGRQVVFEAQADAWAGYHGHTGHRAAAA